MPLDIERLRLRGVLRHFLGVAQVDLPFALHRCGVHIVFHQTSHGWHVLGLVEVTVLVQFRRLSPVLRLKHDPEICHGEIRLAENAKRPKRVFELQLGLGRLGIDVRDADGLRVLVRLQLGNDRALHPGGVIVRLIDQAKVKRHLKIELRFFLVDRKQPRPRLRLAKRNTPNPHCQAKHDNSSHDREFFIRAGPREAHLQTQAD